MSSSEISYFIDGIKQGIRADGRACDAIRPMNLELGVVPTANGSCRVRSKACDILVAIKCDLSRPVAANLEEGAVNVVVELGCGAVSRLQDFAGKQASFEADALSETIGSHIASMCLSGLDRRLFCIQRGKACWNVSVDVLVERIDGPLMDPVSIGIRGAFMNLELPAVAVVEDDEVDGDEQKSILPRVDLLGTLWRLPDSKLSAICVSIGVYCQDTVIMADLDRTEESIAKLKGNSLITVAVNDAGECCGIHKFGSGSLDPLIMKNVIDSGISVGKEISCMLARLRPQH